MKFKLNFKNNHDTNIMMTAEAVAKHLGLAEENEGKTFKTWKGVYKHLPLELHCFQQKNQDDIVLCINKGVFFCECTGIYNAEKILDNLISTSSSLYIKNLEGGLFSKK